MFSSQNAQMNKLKTNLRLVINRLKLLEKKKTEMALKARKEIADYIQSGKIDRARIRVEHIVREDYLVEAMELVEMYCDLLLARFGLLTSQKELDPGLEESVATLIWVAPRLQADVLEMKAIGDLFAKRYSKEFAMACLANSGNNVSEKVMHKMDVHAPPKILIERYLVEIAKSYNVPFEPDESLMREEDETVLGDLIDLERRGGGAGGGAGGGGGGGGFGDPVLVAPSDFTVGGGGWNDKPPPLPNTGPVGGSGGYPPYGGDMQPPIGGYPAYGPPDIAYPPPPPGGMYPPSAPVPGPPPYSSEDCKATPGGGKDDFLGLPELPNVPSSPSSSLRSSNMPPPPPAGSNSHSEDVDFDDLSRRFEELKRRK